MTAATTPWQTLQEILRTDAAAPRVTFYERTPGPTQGERIELSGKVLVNWVSKAANLLSEEFDVGTGSRVCVNLPAAHWRTAYWSLAVWSLGATVVFVDSDAVANAAETSADTDALTGTGVLVTETPDPGLDGDQVVVTLPMLARTAASDVPVGVIDEARELSTFGDLFAPIDQPAPHDAALQIGNAVTRYADLSVAPEAADAALPESTFGTRRLLGHPSPSALMQTLAAGGSVVLVRGPVSDDDLARVLDQESAIAT